MIERKYKSIVDALSTMLDRGSTNWVQNLSAVLWADCSNIHIFTGLILYYISYRSKLVLLIKLEILTWQILPWNNVYSTANLLAIYSR